MTLFHVIPNLNSGGAEQFLLTLSNTLVDDYDQYIFTLKNPEQNDLFSKFSSKINFLHKKKELVQLIRDKNKAVVICWMYPSIFEMERLRFFNKVEADVLWNIRHSSFTTFQFKQKLGLYFLGLISRLKKPEIIYCAQTAKKYHQKFLFSKKSGHVIPNGLTKEFVFSKRREQETPYLLYVGRYIHAKGPDILIDVFKEYFKINKTHLLKIAGHGWDLIKIPRSLRKRVELLGNQEDLASLYANAEAFVFTSRTEGYPNALAEACSFGLPIVTTDAGDSRVILNDYPFGEIVNSKKRFLEKLLNLKRPTEKQQKKAALKFRERNNFFKTKETYIKLFSSL